jgi:hypothetical protein
MENHQWRVNFPMKNGDFPFSYVTVYQWVSPWIFFDIHYIQFYSHYIRPLWLQFTSKPSNGNLGHLWHGYPTIIKDGNGYFPPSQVMFAIKPSFSTGVFRQIPYNSIFSSHVLSISLAFWESLTQLPRLTPQRSGHILSRQASACSPRSRGKMPRRIPLA